LQFIGSLEGKCSAERSIGYGLVFFDFFSCCSCSTRGCSSSCDELSVLLDHHLKYLKYTPDKNILLPIEYTERIRHTSCNGRSSSYRDSGFALADLENIDMSNLMAFNIGNVRVSDIFVWRGCSYVSWFTGFLYFVLYFDP
jgi:hypothetical protein